jgi:hypothetical protein
VNNQSSYFSTTIAAVMLYVLIFCEIDSELKWSMCVHAFLWSIIFLGAIYLITVVGHMRLPQLLSPKWVIKNDLGDQISYVATSSGLFDTHFAGFMGLIENFAEYLFVIFALCIILLQGKFSKKSSDIGLIFCSILISIFFSFQTAVKAYPFMIFLFLLTLGMTSTKAKNRLTIISLLAAACLLLFMFHNILSETFYAKRFSIISERVGDIKSSYSRTHLSSLEKILHIVGRENIESDFLPVIQAGGLFGLGPIVVYSINESNMPYHNLYFSMILSFGGIGSFIYLSFFFRRIFRLWRDRNLDLNLKDSAVGLILLMVILFIEQMKVSAFRLPYGVFCFWFILGLSSSLNQILLFRKSSKMS